MSSAHHYSDDSSMIGGAIEIDYLTQRVVRLNNYFAAYHECLMNQFQHFRLEFVCLQRQLRQLSQYMSVSNSYYHAEEILRRMESVHTAQRNIASASLQLQQYQQGINSKYNLILQQHLTHVINNMLGLPQQEQQGSSGRNEVDNNFVHEFVQNELSMSELSQLNSGKSNHDRAMMGIDFSRHSYLRN